MSDVDTDFTSAVATVGAMSADPGNEVKLRLYALYKQATVGDVEGKRPGFTNPVGRAKYDSWAKVSGMSANVAKEAYVRLVAELAG
ncbi:acyl-CoA-binding protein [Actinopolymorpha alba]|uniref:acyl-CoA-binding protein n=1 Tax=Actinopolymorpha alba TaxID=533267 RepID=UPI00036F1363|nr:acyl-CoA-binding protein [Actinopolymorpha alba]